MTTSLEQAIAKAKTLPAERQEEIAAAVEYMAAPPREFTPEQKEKIERGLAQADRGEFVPEEQVEAFFNRFR